MFWNNVKLEIKKQNITQEWVAKSADINTRTFSGWISKKIMPDVEQAYRIAQALGVSVEYLVTGTSTNPAEQELKELKEQFRKLLKP